ncbi:MAG: aldehyde dehydrogenase family protein [Bifidobacterium sp.]|jgi:aldehyde dehydrogenase (NAD+)|nr:aldehyde dehydrogenase family protein [Bifidobacterium sp.]MCI1865799.1 aldehyde dehydrogenase family protein [Bifidobacterium sp.]
MTAARRKARSAQAQTAAAHAPTATTTILARQAIMNDRETVIFTHLRNGFDRGISRPLSWRAYQLDSMARMVRDNAERITRAVHADMGKPPAETVLMEIDMLMHEIRFVKPRMRMWAARHHKAAPILMQPARTWTHARPQGVVLVISPWNYPLLLSLQPMVDAIAAGNCVCLKPSELAPQTSRLLAELVPRYLDPRAVAVVEGDAGTATRLLSQSFDHVFYTGSGRVGKIVMHAAAEHLTPVTLELGGKSPVFVDGSTNVRVAARRIAWGRFINAGQTCVAPDYVLATPDVADELTKEIGRAIRMFFGADPRASSSYARIINVRQFDRLVGLLPRAEGSGTPGKPKPQEGCGRIAFGGSHDRDDLYVEPTVLTEVDPDSAVMREEIFGPILPVLTIPDAVRAARFINSRPHPLSTYVFSRNPRTRALFEDSVATGALGFGLPLGHLASSRLPFSGMKDSGLGTYHGKAGFLEFSHVTSVTSKPGVPDTLRIAYPPYTDPKRRLFRLL